MIKTPGHFQLGFCLLLVCLLSGVGRTSVQGGLADAAVLNRILASVPEGEDTVKLGDMWVKVSVLEAWRDGMMSSPATPGEITPAGSALSTSPIGTWPAGVVPYSFHSSVSAARRVAFVDAINEWPAFANVRFIPRTSQADFVTVIDCFCPDNGAYLGRVGGEQYLVMGTWERDKIAHEIGHALGLIHEHQRSDRDAFVSVLTGNITPGYEFNFAKMGASLNRGAYDFLSVMHYPRDQFAANANVNTIEPLPAYGSFLNVMGRQTRDRALSLADRTGLAAVYGAPALAPSPVVINTRDSGPGSLRAAIYYAIDHPGTTILFRIPTSDPGFSGGVFTIRVSDQMTRLGAGTTVDGTSQSSYTGDTNPAGPEIVLDGAGAENEIDGLRMTEANCAVRGLAITGFRGFGVRISGAEAVNNRVEGCYVGVGADGVTAAGNGMGGVGILNGAAGTAVGGETLGQRNLISGNHQGGVVIVGAGSIGNAVKGNSIYGNFGPGIDLGGDGVSANDAGDADVGPNLYQNYPELSSVVRGTATVVEGTLNSRPNTLYRLEFFANPACEAGGNREGGEFLGASMVTTDGAGNAGIRVTLANSAALGMGVTATATDPAGNTSEFSRCAAVTGPPPPSVAITSLGSPILENQASVLTAAVTNPPDAPYSAQVQWGDGASQTVNLAGGAVAFTLSHVYADDNPSGTSFDFYTVVVTVGASSASGVARVNNAAPAVDAGLDAVIEPGALFSRTGTFADPGAADTFTGQVNYGDGTGTEALVFEAGRTFKLHHTYAVPGVYTVTVTVTDDDLGTGSDAFLATVASGSSAAAFLEDGFDQPNGTGLGPGWAVSGAALTIVNNEVRGVDGQISVAMANGVSQADLAVEARVDMSGAGVRYGGVVARASGNGFYWAALINNNGVYSAVLYRRSGGVWTSLSSNSVNSGGGLLRLVAVGSALRLYFNDSLLASVSDARVTGAGGVGMLIAGGAFDDFVAAPAKAAVPFTDDFQRPNGAFVGNFWTELAGDASVSNGRVIGAAGQVSLVALNGDASLDSAQEADVDVAGGGVRLAGLAGRASGAGFYWGTLVNNNGQLSGAIYRNSGGAFTVLASEPVAAGSGRLRFEVTGGTMRLFLDGALAVSASDSGIAAPGFGGLLGVGGVFDNYLLTWPAN